MTESICIERWLYTLLTSDTGPGGLCTLVNGRIYSYQAPEGALFPFVVYGQQAGHDVNGIGSIRIMVREIYQVKVVGKTVVVAFETIGAIADRLDTLLQGASGAVIGGYVLSCIREQNISYVENEGSNIYLHLGGLYRIQAQTV